MRYRIPFVPASSDRRLLGGHTRSSAPVGILVFVSIGHNLFADHLAELRRAGEILMAIGGQDFPLNIGETKVVEPATIEDRNDDPASPMLCELTLDQEIRR
jgi:hypothetical protein